MSNGKESNKGGGADTIVLTPDSGNVYPHQGVRIVATITMQKNPIPTNATIDFSGSSHGATQYVKALNHNGQDWTAVPIQIDEGGLTGTAVLYARHDFTDTTNTMVVNAKAGAVWTTNRPSDADTVTYTVLTTQPVITCSGASKTVLAPGDGNQLTPAADASTTLFTITVTDGGGVAVPGYVVEWHEGTDGSLGLFTMLVNSYTSATATYADRLPSANAEFVNNGAGVFIRTTTDINGKASLYLVAKNLPWTIASSIRAHYDFRASYEFPRPFFIFKESMSSESLDGFAPRIKDHCDTITVGSEQKKQLVFKDIEDPPNVRVSITPYKNASSVDDIYLLLNGAIASGPYQFDGPNSPVLCEFPASLAYTSDGADPGQENDLRYIVAVTGTGQLLASESTLFYGKGENIQLLGGILEQPTLKGGVTVINSTQLLSGPVTLQIPLNQLKTANWEAKNGDVFTAVAYLNGYVPDTDVPRAPAMVLADPHAPVADGDFTNGYIELTFPIDPFKGWDRSVTKGNMGSCCFSYTVKRAGEDDKTSRLYVVQMDTANLSF